MLCALRPAGGAARPAAVPGGVWGVCHSVLPWLLPACFALALAGTASIHPPLAPLPRRRTSCPGSWTRCPRLPAPRAAPAPTQTPSRPVAATCTHMPAAGAAASAASPHTYYGMLCACPHPHPPCPTTTHLCRWMRVTPRGWRGWGPRAWWPPPPSEPTTSRCPARQTSSPRWRQAGTCAAGILPAANCGRDASLLHCALLLPTPPTNPTLPVPLPPCLPAMQAVRAFTASASERLGLRLLPYSVFHIFFEQYLTIGGEALTLLGSGARADGGGLACGCRTALPQLGHPSQPSQGIPHHTPPHPPPRMLTQLTRPHPHMPRRPCAPCSLRGHLPHLPGRHGQPLERHPDRTHAVHAAGGCHGLHGAGRHTAQCGCGAACDGLARTGTGSAWAARGRGQGPAACAGWGPSCGLSAGWLQGDASPRAVRHLLLLTRPLPPLLRLLPPL